jgi:chemotaxis protein methyltransferase CheR
MTARDFEFICRLLRERSAVVLEAGKEYLVEARLTPLVRELDLNSIGELISRLRSQNENGLYRRIVEALVTTETSFFRDHTPFESLRKSVIPELARRRSGARRLHIWCAASSNGQEPYSVALLLREYFPELAGWKILILASDLSRQALGQARQGLYSQIEVNRGLPASLLVKYFEQHGTHWQLKGHVRSMVEFQEINLSRDWPVLAPMDLVLLRNVMIYFDVETKKKILAKLVRVLKPDGYLLLGGAETTLNLHDSYRRIESLKGGFYQLRTET